MMSRYVSLLAAVLLVACSDWQVVTYEIPNRFVGKVVVHYGRADCGPRISSRVVVVSTDGQACSERRHAPKGTWSRFYYVDDHGTRVRELHGSPWGGGGEIWGEARSADGDETEFFVGTEQQYRFAYERSGPKKEN